MDSMQRSAVTVAAGDSVEMVIGRERTRVRVPVVMRHSTEGAAP